MKKKYGKTERYGSFNLPILRTIILLSIILVGSTLTCVGPPLSKKSDRERAKNKVENPTETSLSDSNNIIDDNVWSVFDRWESYLIEHKIFDCVSREYCENLMDSIYKTYCGEDGYELKFDPLDHGLYPMSIDSKTFIPFNYNDDGITDYYVSYHLENCVMGNGWTTDFIFITSENGKLQVNTELTNSLKRQIMEYVEKNWPEPESVYYDEEKNYYGAKTFIINGIYGQNATAIGSFDLWQNGFSCCPEYSGYFDFDIINRVFEVTSIKKNKYDD